MSVQSGAEKARAETHLTVRAPNPSTAKQVGRFLSHQLADLLVDAQHPPGLIDLDDTHADMFVGGGQPLFARTQPFFARRSSDIRGGGRAWRAKGLCRPLLDVHSLHPCPQGQILHHTILRRQHMPDQHA